MGDARNRILRGDALRRPRPRDPRPGDVLDRAGHARDGGALSNGRSARDLPPGRLGGGHEALHRPTRTRRLPQADQRLVHGGTRQAVRAVHSHHHRRPAGRHHAARRVRLRLGLLGPPAHARDRRSPGPARRRPRPAQGLPSNARPAGDTTSTGAGPTRASTTACSPSTTSTPFWPTRRATTTKLPRPGSAS